MIKIAKEISFEEFLEKIKKTKTYCSNANKEYRVMKANKDKLVLRDQRTRNVYEVSTMQLYVAMQECEIQNCTVANMKFYVGAKAAPSCAALIFAVFGRGQMYESIRLIAEEVFRNIRRRR